MSDSRNGISVLLLVIGLLFYLACFYSLSFFFAQGLAYWYITLGTFISGSCFLGFSEVINLQQKTLDKLYNLEIYEVDQTQPTVAPQTEDK